MQIYLRPDESNTFRNTQRDTIEVFVNYWKIIEYQLSRPHKFVRRWKTDRPIHVDM